MTTIANAWVCVNDKTILTRNLDALQVINKRLDLLIV